MFKLSPQIRAKIESWCVRSELTRKAMNFPITTETHVNPAAWAEKLVRPLQQLGRGCFAQVYQADDPNMVIKVSRENDMGYWAYLEEMSRNTEANPWLPRVHWVKKVTPIDPTSGDAAVFVTCLERLERPWPEDSGEVKESQRAMYDEVTGKAEDIERSVRGGDRVKWISQDLNLCRAIELIARARRNCGRGVDLHQGNFMLRGEQLVITDPIGY